MSNTASFAPGLHQLLACDLVQNLLYLVQLHHCTKARYAYGVELERELKF